MKIILDIDGVLTKTPGWKKSEVLDDGFLKFDITSRDNIVNLLSRSNASIILLSTHRINYTIGQWVEIFKIRGIDVFIEKIDNKTSMTDIDKISEIKEWASRNKNESYIIIDDDSSLNDLPMQIKLKWVKTNSLVGFDINALNEAVKIINKL